MTRRYLLAAGLVLLTFALIGVGLLPQSGTRSATDQATLYLPDNLQQELPPVTPTFGGGSSNPVVNFASSPPWVTASGVLLCVFAAIAYALFAAQSRTQQANAPARPDPAGPVSLLKGRVEPRPAPQVAPRGATPLWGYGVFIFICLLGCFLMVIPVYVRPLMPAAPPTGGTLTANELTNDFMQTAISYTATSGFQTQSAPTHIPAETATPTPRPVIASGAPMPASLTTDRPLEMDAGDTQYVRIFLAYASRGNMFGMITPLPPGPYADPFGSDYTAAISATLSGEGVRIALDSRIDASQPFDEGHGAAWAWRITPNAYSAGSLRLLATIEGTWTPVDPQRETIHRVLAQPVIIVNVAHPVAPPDTLRLLTLAAALLGSIACIPWLYATFRGGRPA